MHIPFHLHVSTLIHNNNNNKTSIMSSSEESGASSSSSHSDQNKLYRGVRRRKWGKWVSEIRVPGSQERLWLGSYATPEAAAVAHDIASYCLRGRSSLEKLNFPLVLPAGVRDDMSPNSVQKVASDAGMAVDAQMVVVKNEKLPDGDHVPSGRSGDLSISIDDYM